MSKSLNGFKWLIGAVMGVSLGACGTPSEDVSSDRAGEQFTPGHMTATVSVAKASLAASENVTVTVTLTNESSQPVRLLKWHTPGEGLMEGRLSVTRHGQPVAYLGAHYKRVAPRPQDYVTLAPGEHLTGPVAVSDVYDLSQTGTYSIRYDLAGFASNEVSLFIEGRPSSLEQADAQRQVSAASISYSGACTSTEKSLINAAVSNAANYANTAYNYLNATPPLLPTRYTTWFGLYSSTNWNTAKSHFSNIKDALVNAAIVADCSCEENGIYAYVYPASPYKIYLCNAFWNAPATGTDSKAGTFVHEMSHFTVVAGTGDYAYGKVAATALALSNPSQALNNADNHEYFAENTPYLP